MNTWLTPIVTFVCVSTGLMLALVAVPAYLRDRSRVAKRYASLGPPQPQRDDIETLRKRESPLSGLTLVTGLLRLLRQSGTIITLPRFLLTLVGLSALPTLVLSVRLPFVSAAIIGFASATLLLLGYLRVKRARRIARFGEQLPEVIDVIVRSLRAGHPLSVSLALVVREMPPPAGPEFAIAVDEVNYGRSLAEALDRLRDRVGYPELQFFVASVSIAHQTGGNLGEVLTRLSRMLRERFRVRRRARALSAEGRFSGLALSALPVILFGIINLVSADYYADVWASSAAPTIIGSCVVLLVMGNLAIYKLVNFRV